MIQMTITEFKTAIGNTCTAIKYDSTKADGVILSENSTIAYVKNVQITNAEFSSLLPDTITIADLRGLDITAAISFTNCFSNSSALTNLDLSTWNTSNITAYDNMFSGLTLTQCIVSDAWTLGHTSTFGGAEDIHFYVYKHVNIIGKSDISTVGDGTITGAISSINTVLEDVPVLDDDEVEAETQPRDADTLGGLYSASDITSINESLAYSSYVVETTITGMTTTRIGTYTTDYSKTFVLGFIIDLDGNSYNSNGSTDEEQVWLYNGGIYMRGTTTSKIGRPIKIILGVLK